MKNIAYILAGAALALTPVAASAQRGSGHSSHVGGRISSGGGISRGTAYRGGAYRGGFYRGGFGYRHRGAWPFFYGPALGLYLGYYADPWFWGYPGWDYYGYPYYPYPSGDYGPPPPPPAGDQSNYGSTANPSSGQAPADCGHWQWDAAKRQYNWIAKACQ